MSAVERSASHWHQCVYYKQGHSRAYLIGYRGLQPVVVFYNTDRYAGDNFDDLPSQYLVHADSHNEAIIGG